MKAKIHLIPTDKPSRLVQRRITKELKFSLMDNPQLWNNINIYITDNSEIKKGDWFYTPIKRSIEQCVRKLLIVKGGNNDVEQLKIILTTDQDLINDGVQAIDDEFLEWFVKNPTCESVEVKKEYITPLGDIVETCYDNERLNYKIIIPKEEPKQETIKDISYWKQNAEEDYLKVPISVLRYISVLEEQAKTMYSEEEVRQLLLTQRGNSYVAILNKTKDKGLAVIASGAPEPSGKDGWVKKYNNEQ